MNSFTLNLESDAFNALKTDFNQILRRTLAGMEQKEAEDATITLKLGIALTRDMVPDPTIVAYEAQREIVRPAFTHKISSVMQYKDEKSGILSGNYELVWDKELCDYVMREITNGQTSLFDKEPPPPPAPPPALPPATGEVIDVKFTEAPPPGDGYGYEPVDEQEGGVGE